MPDRLSTTELSRPTELAAPTQLAALAELAALSERFADEVREGRPHVVFDAEQRWHRRIYRDANVDVWLLSWLPSQGTTLHDHGGSQGAFTVVSGALTESVPCGFADGRVGIRGDLRAAGQTAAFGPHHVHDVTNAGPAAAVSVHAYSPPLTSMRFYDVRGADVVPVSVLATDDPEASPELALPIAS